MKARLLPLILALSCLSLNFITLVEGADPVQNYINALEELRNPIESSDSYAAAQAINQLGGAHDALEEIMEDKFTRLKAVYPIATEEIPGFEGNYSLTVDSYSMYLAKQADLYASLSMWLGGEPLDKQQLLSEISETVEAILEAWKNLVESELKTGGLTVPAVLTVELESPERTTIKETIKVLAEVKNRGDLTARVVKATLSANEMLSVISSSVITIGDLAPGETRLVEWTLAPKPNASPGYVASFWLVIESDSADSVDVDRGVLLTFGDSGKIEFTLHSPVLMVVTDYLGRSVGFDPESDGVLNEIPGATYTGRASSPQMITLPDPLGTYSVDMLGIGEGEYTLDIKTYQDGKLLSTQTSRGSAKKDTWITVQASVVLTDGIIFLEGGSARPPHIESYQPTITNLDVKIDGVTTPKTPGASISRIHWSWGDGVEEDKFFPNQHTYGQEGVYIVTITAYQSDGLKNSTIISIQLSEAQNQNELKFTFEKTGNPPSGSSDDLALAFDYIQFLDKDNLPIMEIDVGTVAGRDYLVSGWYTDQLFWDEVEDYAWAGGDNKTAIVYTPKLENASKILVKVRPFMENNPTRVYFDGELISTITPVRGWKEYIVSLSKLKASITCQASATKTNPGEEITIRGSLTPTIADASINLSIKAPSGHLSTMSLKINTDGSYSYSFKPIDKGEWSAYAEWAGNSIYSNATSSMVTWSISENITQPPAGIPGYSLEGIILGVIILLIFTRTHAQRSS